MFEREIQSLQHQLVNHAVYQSLVNLDNLKLFMNYDCLALWTNMTLLKALQQRITCIHLPWFPSPQSPEVVRFINELVLYAESDLDHNGQASSHFESYFCIMKNLQANTSSLELLIETGEFDSLPFGAQDYTRYLIELAFNGSDEEVAASLLLGREKVLPRANTNLKNTLLKNGVRCPEFDHLLQRQIEIGSAHHAPFAQVCFELICQNDHRRKLKAMQAAKTTLELNLLLWNVAQQALGERHARPITQHSV